MVSQLGILARQFAWLTSFELERRHSLDVRPEGGARCQENDRFHERNPRSHQCQRARQFCRTYGDWN